MEALKETQLYCPFAYIDGSWVAADSGEQIQVINPATGEAVGDVPRLGRAETERAIDAAYAALPAWRALSALERADILMKWHDLMLEHQNDLAMIMTHEQGKPLKEAAGEIAYAASFLRWFAEEARRVYGETIPPAKGNQRIVVTKQPVGVVGAITPWNFPAAMITRKAGAALAAGCTIVCKPASQTPFSATALALLAERAGVPRGVFNVVPGRASEIAAAMTESPLVRKITFTGSTEVGRELMASASQHIQKISLELGGNAPFIVFEDADLDAAVEGAMAAKFRNAGQTCVCTNRFLVQSSVVNAFCEKLAVAMNSELRVGDGTQPDINIGPLIDHKAVDKVSEHVHDAVDKGAELLLGGHPHPLGGNFFTPTLISFATEQMQVAREETFGPLAAVFPFDDEESAVEMANDTEYGLAAYFYSRDLGREWRITVSQEGGMEEARDLAEAMLARGEGKRLDQFANPDNPLSHYRGTGPEIWEQTAGSVTHFISSMGTTGTIMGVSQALKERNPDVEIIGLQPEDGASIAGIRRWPEAYLPSIFDASRVDRVLDIGQHEAEEHMRRLAREEGILAGVSSGGALAGALRVAEQVEDAVIVFIVCDRGDRYLSTGLYAPEG